MRNGGVFQPSGINSNSEPSENFKKTWLQKYGESLKTLVPIRFGKQTWDKGSLPNSGLGLFNFISLQWMDNMMWSASRKGIQREDVKRMNSADRVEANSERISRLWNEELKVHGYKNASLSRAVWKFSRARLIMAGVLMGFTCTFQFLGPAWVFMYLLDYLGDSSQPLWLGIVLATVLSIVQLLRNFCCSAMFVSATHTGVRAQAALQMLIFEKVLKINLDTDKLTAEVFNYFTNDVERIDMMMQQSMFVVGVPVMCLLSIVYCYLAMGPWSLLGNAMVLLYYPAMALVAKRTGKLRLMSVTLTDSRISLMSQILNSIKLIKMYAWESKFSERIYEIRKKEEKVLFEADFLQSTSLTFPLIVLSIAPMASFIGHVLSGHNLTASVAFSVMTVFPVLQLALNTLPMAVKSISEGLVCCTRIQGMLLTENFTLPDNVGHQDSKYAVNIRGADLAWIGTKNEDDAKPNKTPRKTRKTLKTEQSWMTNEYPMNMGHGGTYTQRRSVCRGTNLTRVNSLDSGIINPAFLEMISGNDETLDANPENLTVVAMSDINLRLKKGQLIGICGNVGSGKSTFLAGISGEAIVVKGTVNVRGSVALATQQAWIFNATLRDNIIFGLPFNEERYNMVVDVCCLTTDFDLMPNGDQTEIGEKGANLSGGQKQRVNLARALYSDRDVYLLDDTLSAVDVKVGKFIFQKCIKKALAGKTVLLVTHAVNVLEQCDYILLMKDGEIGEQGTHKKLIDQKGDYYQMYQCDQQQRSENKANSNNNDATAQAVPEVETKIKPDEGIVGDSSMIKEEVDMSNRITWSSIFYYSRACGGYFVSLLAIFTIALFGVSSIFNSIWLQIWLDDGSGTSVVLNPVVNNVTNTSSSETYNLLDKPDNADYSEETSDNVTLNPKLNMYVTVYGICGVILIVCGIIKSFTVIKVIMTGGKVLHRNLFNKVLRSPVSFFDTTPLGRILGRFSKDMDEMDVLIPYITDFVSQTLMLIVFRFILIGVIYNMFFIAIAIVAVIYILMDIFLIGAVREAKRVENLLRPPVLVHISTTIQGLAVIRTFKKEQMFMDKFKELVDKHLSSYLVYQLSTKWVAFRVDTLSWLTITATCIMILATKGQVSPAIAGLAMSQMFQICSILAIIARFKSELEAKLISIERIVKYCKTLTEEAIAIDPNNRRPANWPANGNIKFDKVQMKYRHDTPLVLHDLTVDIKGGEKVGIIGRTGAGKSTIIGCLLRLTEVSSGSITIDGVDISKIGLEDLRSNIAVIPQEPVLFQGTIRWNLDPFGVCKDEEIWDALEKTHLKKKVSKEPKQLENMLGSEGGSFSLGEKQLFCMARALLRKNKVLLLDEATASVDVETDKLIQATIRKSFVGCTVLTIAHRLNTIVDYEKILSMDAGRVIEFDSPENLLSRDSVFRSMLRSMAEATDQE